MMGTLVKAQLLLMTRQQRKRKKEPEVPQQLSDILSTN